MSTRRLTRKVICAGMLSLPLPIAANDTVESRLMTLPLAADIAGGPIEAARVAAELLARAFALPEPSGR